jgi:peptidoglycan hydrolase-like protein with peptidoglycan-binding domain
MRRRKASHLALTLLVAAGMGVSGAAAKGQGTGPAKSPAAKPSSAAKPGSKAHHGKSTKKTTSRQRGQKEPSSDRISEIQTALAKDGSFTGNPNGKWDAATVDAMKKYQEAHGLNPSGKLDAKTLQKLGLGSQTAGLAPPMPPVSSSSLATSPSAKVRRQQ